MRLLPVASERMILWSFKEAPDANFKLQVGGRSGAIEWVEGLGRWVWAERMALTWHISPRGASFPLLF